MLSVLRRKVEVSISQIFHDMQKLLYQKVWFARAHASKMSLLQQKSFFKFTNDWREYLLNGILGIF